MPELVVGGRSFAVSGILFDKDGTLLEFVSMWGCWSEHLLHVYNKRLKEQGLELPPERIPSLLGTIHRSDGTVAEYDRNGPLAMGTVDDLYAILSWHGYRLGLSWAAAKELVHECKAAADEELERVRPARLISGAAAFLDACRIRRIPLAVVTADETDAAEKHLEWLGIRQYFAVVIGSDEVKRGKPFPDMMELACRRLSIDCRAAAIIGDTNGDMKMGKAAGSAAAIGIGGLQPLAEAASLLPDADIVIGSYEDLRFGEMSDEA